MSLRRTIVEHLGETPKNFSTRTVSEAIYIALEYEEFTDEEFREELEKMGMSAFTYFTELLKLMDRNAELGGYLDQLNDDQKKFVASLTEVSAPEPGPEPEQAVENIPTTSGIYDFCFQALAGNKRQEMLADLYTRLWIVLGIGVDNLRLLTSTKPLSRVFEEKVESINDDLERKKEFELSLSQNHINYLRDHHHDVHWRQRATNSKERNWRLVALAWRSRCPVAYKWCEDRALMYLKQKQNIGINLIREELRWLAPGLDKQLTEGYMFPNDISPYVSRMLIKDHPDLGEIINTKETKW